MSFSFQGAGIPKQEVKKHPKAKDKEKDDDEDDGEDDGEGDKPTGGEVDPKPSTPDEPTPDPESNEGND